MKNLFLIIFCLLASGTLRAQSEEWRHFVPEKYRGNPEYENYYRQHYENWKKQQRPLRSFPRAEPRRKKGYWQPRGEKKFKRRLKKKSQKNLNDEKRKRRPRGPRKKRLKPILPSWRLLASAGIHRSKFEHSAQAELDQIVPATQVSRSLSGSSSSGVGFNGGLGLEKILNRTFALRASFFLNRYYYTGNNLYLNQQEDKIDFKYLSLDIAPVLDLNFLRLERTSFYLLASLRAHFLVSAAGLGQGRADDLEEANFRKIMFGAMLGLGARYELRKNIEGLSLELYYDRALKGPFNESFARHLEKEIVDKDSNISRAQVGELKSALSSLGLQLGYFYNF